MNPFRSLMLWISKLPPAVLLASVIGIATLVTIVVTNQINDKMASYDAKTHELQQRMNLKGKVVFALKDIPDGQEIPSEAVEEREVELGKIPVDAITSSSLAVGRTLKFGVQAGQVISQHDLQAMGTAAGLEARLKPGMRAVTFAIDTNSGVAGFVSPESHVDILSMVGSGPDVKAKPILSDIEVIAVGDTLQRPPGGDQPIPASSVTVAVSPEDTQKLVKAISASKLYLALRNSSDREPVATADVTQLFAKNHGGAAQAMAMDPQFVPPMVPAPPPLPGGMADGVGSLAPMDAASAPGAPPHAIELWSGDSKKIITVPPEG